MRTRTALVLRHLYRTAVLTTVCCAAPAAEKPPLTLDDHFNYVSITEVVIAPDGDAVVVATKRADWEHERFREDLWIWRESTGRLDALTQSGHDSAAAWSPDGRWIAFLSDRKNAGDTDPKSPSSESSGAQVFVIPVSGGESSQVTRGEEEVHAFAWSADSRAIFFATRIPQSAEQKKAHESEWRDVDRPREDARGDVICRIKIDDAVRLASDRPAGQPDASSTALSLSPGAMQLASVPWFVGELAAAPDGRTLACGASAPTGNFENVDSTEIYTLDLVTPADEPRRITRNEAWEVALAWHADSHMLSFAVDFGYAEGSYRYAQAKLYSIDTLTGTMRKWAADFQGGADIYDVPYALCPDGCVVAPGIVGPEQQLFAQLNVDAPFLALRGHPGTYTMPSTARRSQRLAFVHSALGRPAEVYLAADRDHIAEGRAITSFNSRLLGRALPSGQPYRWSAPDGATIEGMLIYPPGRSGEKCLKTVVLIHGGPTSADGNCFLQISPHYDWAALAATQGWLVFRPNYRGSVGYGDEFCRQIAGPLVSLPGKDILSGIDALVRDGIADPDHLAIGGYSYGGYLTNWLITQTDRFKAAVSCAGAVEHAANWGLDDVSADDECLLGGTPWSNPLNYHAEAALFQAHKIRTPTLISCPADDVRVAAAENHVFERALHRLGVPCSIMVFPGEGHGLDANPWHGLIKVREELKWIERYAGGGAG